MLIRVAQIAGSPPLPPSGVPSIEQARETISAQDRIIDRFMRLRNAGDPAANLLLGPESAFPDHPVSEDEAERLQADHFLRQGLRITTIRRQEPFGMSGPPSLPSDQHYLLVTEGNVAAPTLTVQTARGLERSQRTMSNPDVEVVVREGRMVALRALLHRDPQIGDPSIVTPFPLPPGWPLETPPQ